MSNPRKEYEFTGQTKREALEAQNYRCDGCGTEDKRTGRLQAHHVVAIWFAREMGISSLLIKSLENCVCLCQKCHTERHLQEDRTQYAIIAQALLGVDVNPDESKDDWRKDPNHPINRLSKKKLRKQRKRKGKSNSKRRR